MSWVSSNGGGIKEGLSVDLSSGRLNALIAEAQACTKLRYAYL